MDVLHEHIAVTFGLVMTAALVGGLIADSLRLPKVTAYLFVGLLLGPQVLDLLVEDHVQVLEPLTKLAMGLVLFNLGCQFPVEHFRRIRRRVFRLSAGELLVTFTLVTGGLVLIGQSVALASLLGALSLATAPATTILVLKEYESEGPVTEMTEALVIMNNLASVLAFELFFLAILGFRGTSDISWYSQIGFLSINLAGSLLLGASVGMMVSFSCSLVPSSHWLVLLVAATTIMLGVDEILNIPYMLSFLAMGLTVANTSDLVKSIVADIDRLTGFLCVLFFVIHGAELDLYAFVEAGLVGVAYILLRSAGKYFGIFVAASSLRESEPVRHWLGASMMAQAGAAIALSATAVRRDPGLGRQIQTVVLGSVVVFEIAGPLLIRLSVLRAGEVPIIRAVHHSSSTPLAELRLLWFRLLIALGRNPTCQRSPEELKVRDMVRRNVQPLSQSATFDEVISRIEQSRDNTYAVVDDGNTIVGMIHFANISHELLDRNVSTLVRAADISSPKKYTLSLDDPLTKALEIFRTIPDDCLAVSETNAPYRYVGMVQRRDVVGYLVQRNKTHKQR